MTRREGLALGGLVLGMLVSLYFFVHAWYAATNDGAMYILTARSLLRGEGYSMLGQPFLIRPPAFSVLLAPILALKDGTSELFYWINMYVSLFGVLGCTLFYFVVRARLGAMLAWCAALALWLNPGFQTLCNQPMSDVPGTALLFGCLLLERFVARNPSWRRDLLLGICIGLAAYVRSVDLLLMPAILGVRFLARIWPPKNNTACDESARSYWTRSLMLAAGTILVMLPWNLRNRALEPTQPVDQVLLASYGGGMWHTDKGDLSSPKVSTQDILDRIPVQWEKTRDTLGTRLMRAGSGITQIAGFFLLALLVIFIKRRESAELFCLGSLLVILVYFGFATRLLLPIYALALPAAAEMLCDLIGLVRKSAGKPLAAVGLLALSAADFHPHFGWQEVEQGHTRLERAKRRIQAWSEPDAVFASGRAWHLGVLLEQPVYALEFTWLRDPRPRAIEALIDRYGINTVVLTNWEARDRMLQNQYIDRKYQKTKQSDAYVSVYRVRP